ncbi:MAG: winged helix-turn-helix transcriptional regulator [Conexivisphaera sp.]
MSEDACMIVTDEGEICVYPSEGVLRLLGKEYTILIIGLLGNRGSARFNEISRSVGNPRPNLLSIRLRELEEAGLVERRVVQSRPPGGEYSLTERGRELRRLLIPIFRWLEEQQRGGSTT